MNKTRQLIKKHEYILHLIFLSALTMLKYVQIIDIFFYFGLFALATYAIVLKSNPFHLISIAIFIQFGYSGGNQFETTTLYVSIFVILFFLLDIILVRKRFKVGFLALPLGLMVALNLFSGINGISLYSTMAGVLILSGMFFVYIYYVNVLEDTKIKDMIVFFSSITIIIILQVIYKSCINFDLINQTTYWRSLNLGWENINIVVYFHLVFLPILAYKITLDKQRLFYIVTTVILVITIFLTNSRSAYLTTGVMIIFLLPLVYLDTENKNRLLIHTFYTLVLSIVLMLILYYLGITQVILETVFNDDVLSLSGRDEIYNIGWQKFIENPIIGSGGIYSSRYYLEDFYAKNYHNTFLQVLSMGLLGLAAFVFLWVRKIQLLLKVDNHIKYYVFIMLIATAFINGFFQPMYFSTNYYIYILLILAFVEVKYTKKQEYYDSHLHLLGLGYNESLIDLTKIKSIDDFKNITSNKEFIIGRGWHQNNFVEQREPTKFDLEYVSKDKPVIFIRVCGHVLVCNDKAMELAGITKDTPQIEGGTFNFETGIFTEDALGLIYGIIPKPTKEDIKEMFIKGNDILLSHNITRCASDDFSTLPVPYELIIESLEELYNEGLMKVNLYEQVNLPSKELLLDYINKGYHKKKFNGFRMGPLKLLADGSLGGRTAYLNKDYSDDPGNRGIKVFSDEELEELIYIADSNGMDVAIHAIGDGMIDIVLNAIEKSLLITKRTTHRHSIIHAQLANRRQIKKMKELGVSVIVQPIFLNSDIPIIKQRIGKERMKESYLFKTMYKEGLVVGFSTDAPVEDVNPQDNIKVAMTRKSLKHKDLDAFLPEEAFTKKEAMKCYWENNLWLSYDEETSE